MKPVERFELRNLQASFFLFGLGIMCLAPRLPEIKANLGVSTTLFGILISTGSIGALSAHLTMGHVVHRFGVFKVMITGTIVTYLTLGILVEASNPFLYFVVNVISGFAWASHHIAINAQGIHRQNESGQQIIPMLHGLWSAGAVSTAFIALLISSRVSLNWHLYPLLTMVLILQLRAILKLRPTLLAGNEVTEDDEIVTFGTMLRSFSIDWVVSLGFLCAILLEIAISDWATILARQEFGVSKSLAVIPYFVFMGGMIIGRVSFSRLRGEWSDRQLVQPFAVVGGVTFLIGLFLGLQIKETNLHLGYSIFCVAAFVAGIGISFIAPLFFGYASARSNKPSGVVIAELGAVNQLLTFSARNVIAVIAGITSIQFALVIPAIALILVIFFIKAASQPRN